MTNETIFALSSPYGISGVSVIRMSGSDCKLVLNRLCKTKITKPRFAFYKEILDFDSKIIDKGLVIFFKAPKTFTGEDMLEFHVHGSIAVIKKILKTLNNFQNLRAAEPGEFSKRAYLNNKINILEAEGTYNLIRSETELQRKVSISQSFGTHFKVCMDWRNKLIEISSMIDAQIEFYQEDSSISDTNIFINITELKEEIKQAIMQSEIISKIFSGSRLLIIGPPNVGKSTFFNFLIKENKSIVSKIPGTTRDQVDSNIHLFGKKVNITDSAGVRVSNEEIEMLGIKKTNEKFLSTNKIIMVLSPDALTIENISFIQKIRKDLIKKKVILVYNKSDIDLYKMQKKRWEKEIPELKKIPNIEISLNLKDKSNKTYTKIINLIKEILLEKHNITEQEFFFTELRQLEHLKKSLSFLEVACTLFSKIELLSEEVRLALNELEKITERIDSEKKLEIIFNKFCIGK